jgi:predicted nucleic acid-binding Zn ribbon protein
VKKTCIMCSGEYDTHHPLKLTCSEDCSDNLRNRRRSERYQRAKVSSLGESYGRTSDGG